MTRAAWCKQLRLIGLGYLAVLAMSAGLGVMRYLHELANPEVVTASSGMYAAGDTMLLLFCIAVAMIPTAFAIRLLAQFDRPFLIYARALCGLSLTAPPALLVTHYDSFKVLNWGVLACVVRLIGSPFVLGAIAVAHGAARKRRAPAKDGER